MRQLIKAHNPRYTVTLFLTSSAGSFCSQSPSCSFTGACNCCSLLGEDAGISGPGSLNHVIALARAVAPAAGQHAQRGGEHHRGAEPQAAAVRERETEPSDGDDRDDLDYDDDRDVDERAPAEDDDLEGSETHSDAEIDASQDRDEVEEPGEGGGGGGGGGGELSKKSAPPVAKPDDVDDEVEVIATRTLPLVPLPAMLAKWLSTPKLAYVNQDKVTWACTNCTLHNQRTTRRCAACNAMITPEVTFNLPVADSIPGTQAPAQPAFRVFLSCC
jgi:hypothetical protein